MIEQAFRGVGNAINWLVAITLLFLSATLILNYSFTQSIGIYDEGFILTNALRILREDVPHRDFWAAYPSGGALVLAIAFKISEPSLLVARIVNAAWSLMLVGSTYWLVAQLHRPAIAAITATITSLWISEALYPSYPVIPALALSVTALALLLNGIQRNQVSMSVGAGVLLGSVVAFRLDFGFYGFVAGLFVLVTYANHSNYSERRPRAYIQTFFTISLLTSIACLVALIAWSGLGEFWDQTVVFPGTVMHRYRSLPVPSFGAYLGLGNRSAWLQAWMPPLFIAIGLLIAIISGSWKEPRCRIVLTFAGVLSILLLLQSRSRFSASHAAPSILFSMVFLCGATVQLKWSGRRSLGSMFPYVGVLLFTIPSAELVLSPNHIENLNCVVPFGRSSCMPRRTEQDDVINFLRSRTTSSAPIFIGNTRHDKIFVNDASLYFLLQHSIPIKWNEMHPGVVTTRSVQFDIIDSLENKKVNYAVLAKMDNRDEPNESSISSDVRLLDEYLQMNFTPIFVNSGYVVLQRK